MRRIYRSKKFLKDLARIGRSDFVDEVEVIAEHLQRHGSLPAEYLAHPLIWQWSGFWDVHLDADWILIYRVTAKKVMLVRIVSHKTLRAGKP